MINETKTLHQKLVEIQKTLKVAKSQHNDFGGYDYRSCEDILEAVKPLLGDLVLTLNDEAVLVGDWHYIRATACLGDGDKNIYISATAREAEVKKGMDSAQITGSTSSYARKYALNGLFAIDDTKDADTMDNRTQDNKPKPKTETKGVCADCGASGLIQTVVDYSTKNYGKVLCYQCQQKQP